MKKLCLILWISLLFLGCTTTTVLVQVGHGVNISNGTHTSTYALPIEIEYVRDPVKLKYVVNSWVIEQGFTSYDLEVRIFGNMATCYVTIPGSTPAERLPVVEHTSINYATAFWASVAVAIMFLPFLLIQF